MSLRYPPGALVLIAGLPGAGKSTLIFRLYGLNGAETTPVTVGDVVVIDSRQARNWWAPRLRMVPQRARTPIVHTTHVWRIVRAMTTGRAVVAHTRGTWPHLLFGLSWLAHRLGNEMHLLLLDVSPQTARTGQYARGRTVTSFVFARHCRRWRILVSQARAGTLTRADGVIVLDREAADQIKEIHIAAP